MDYPQLPVKVFALKEGDRTRIMVQVADEAPFEMISYPSDRPPGTPYILPTAPAQ